MEPVAVGSGKQSCPKTRDERGAVAVGSVAAAASMAASVGGRERGPGDWAMAVAEERLTARAAARNQALGLEPGSGGTPGGSGPR